MAGARVSRPGFRLVGGVVVVVLVAVTTVAGASGTKSHALKLTTLTTKVKAPKLVVLSGTKCTYNSKTHEAVATGQENWASTTGGGAQGIITVTFSAAPVGKKKPYSVSATTPQLFEGAWTAFASGGKPVTHCTVTGAFAPPTAESVEAVFAAAQLPITGLIAYNATTDPNHLLGRPTGYLSKDAWQDTRIDQSSQPSAVGDVSYGGGIEVFPEASGAQSRANYLQAIDASSSLFGSEYDYTLGPILVRISGTLIPSQAATFQAVIPALTLFHYSPPGTPTTTTTAP